MKAVITTLLLMTSLCQIAFCQNPEIVSIGYPSSAGIAEKDGLIDSEGNHVIIMYDTVCRIVFYDTDFNLEWVIRLGIFNNITRADKLIELSDGTYVALIREGTTATPFIMRFDKQANIIWQKKFLANWGLKSVVQLDNGNIVVGGDNSDNAFIMVFDPDGSIVWSKETVLHVGERSVSTDDLIITNDGSLLLVATKQDRPPEWTTYQVFTKFKKDGEVLWQKQYLRNSLAETINHVIQSSDGQIYTVGGIHYSSDITDRDMAIRKYDLEADYNFGKGYGFIFIDEGTGIIEMEDGGFLATGISRPVENCGGNFLVVKIDTNLDTIFTKQYGKNGGLITSHFDRLKRKDNALYAYGDGYMFLSPGLPKSGHLIMPDNDFNIGCHRWETPITITNISSHTYIDSTNTFAPYQFTPTDTSFGYTVSTPLVVSSFTCPMESLSVQGLDDVNHLVSPNPASDNINFSTLQTGNVEIRNSLGQLVIKRYFPVGKQSIDVSRLPIGIYFLRTEKYSKQFTISRH